MISAFKNAWSSLTQKTKDDCPIAIPLPDGLDPERLMDIFGMAHQNKWMVLQKHPVLAVYGSSDSCIIPELLLVHRTLWIHKDDSNHIEPLKHTLVLLS